MPDVNIGSIATILVNGIVPMPTGISGNLPTIIQNKIYFVNNYTGDGIGSVIPEKYQSIITDMAMADALRFMAVQDMGVQSMSLGGNDISTDNKNLSEIARQLDEKAMLNLNSLTKGMFFYKARG